MTDDGASGLRDKILDAATELFGEKGYEKASMRQIADRIGYSATAIYLHFANKDDLMFAVVDAAFVRLEASLDEAVVHEGSAADRLRRIAWAYVDFGLKYPTHYRLMFVDKPEFLMARKSEGTGLRIQSLDVFQSVIERLVPAARGARTLGQFSDAVWASVHGVVLLANRLPTFDRPRALKAADLAIELVAAGIELAATAED